MIHNDKKQFLNIIKMIANRTGFYTHLIEKDYYLSLILLHINDVSDNLIFKGGTCLNKIYFSYYRLSEDLDFCLHLPKYTISRNQRSKLMKPIKENILKNVKEFGMNLDISKKPGRNESKQYVFYFLYNSVVFSKESFIKVEISLRFNHLTPIEKHSVKHVFLHPFTGLPLFQGGKVNCLSLNEVVSEKLRAAALRLHIAPRDFYDIDFILRNGFNLNNKVVELFKKKLVEDHGDPDILKYKINLGRSEKEINEMRSRIKEELLDVLTPNERKVFDFDTALKRINGVMQYAE